ncbi:MAG: hypothetical protein ACLU4P_00005 [Ruminococcus sp.]
MKTIAFISLEAAYFCAVVLLAEYENQMIKSSSNICLQHGSETLQRCEENIFMLFPGDICPLPILSELIICSLLQLSYLDM